MTAVIMVVNGMCWNMTFSTKCQSHDYNSVLAREVITFRIIHPSNGSKRILETNTAYCNGTQHMWQSLNEK